MSPSDAPPDCTTDPTTMEDAPQRDKQGRFGEGDGDKAPAAPARPRARRGAPPTPPARPTAQPGDEDKKDDPSKDEEPPKASRADVEPMPAPRYYMNAPVVAAPRGPVGTTMAVRGPAVTFRR